MTCKKHLTSFPTVPAASTLMTMPPRNYKQWLPRCNSVEVLFKLKATLLTTLLTAVRHHSVHIAACAVARSTTDDLRLPCTMLLTAECCNVLWGLFAGVKSTSLQQLWADAHNLCWRTRRGICAWWCACYCCDAGYQDPAAAPAADRPAADPSLRNGPQQSHDCVYRCVLPSDEVAVISAHATA